MLPTFEMLAALVVYPFNTVELHICGIPRTAKLVLAATVLRLSFYTGNFR